MSAVEISYSDEQANEILRTAVRLSAPSEIGFEELVAAAKELGISRDELKEAEAKYRQMTSDPGQRETFKEMQKRELHAFSFRIFLIALIAALLAIFDLPDFRIYLLPLIVVAAVGFVYFKWKHLWGDSPKHEEAFVDWQRKKNIWLRPEQAQAIVAQMFQEELVFKDRLSHWAIRDEMQRRLREEMGYDGKRAAEVVEAFLREHPEVEESLTR